MRTNFHKKLHNLIKPSLNNQLHYSLRRTFWPFSSSSKEEEEKTIPPPTEEQQENQFAKMNNLSFLVENARTEIQKRRKPLLPPKANEDTDKLTVITDIDDIFLHVFYPDEYEGY